MSRWLREGWEIEAEQDPGKSVPRTAAKPAVSREVLDALREVGVPMENQDDADGGASGDPVAWQLLAHCLEEMGEEGSARRCYRRAARHLVRSRREAAVHLDPLPFAVFRPMRDDVGH